MTMDPGENGQVPDPEAFILEMLPYALDISPKIGFFASVILAQWCDETYYGTSLAWVNGHNPAGVSPGGAIEHYPSVQLGMTSYENTALAHYYDPVRQAYPQGAIAQADALGAGPWAGGHYTDEGGRPGSSLVDIITEYNLTEYDPAGSTPAAEPTTPTTPEDDMPRFFSTTDLQTGHAIGADIDGNVYAEDGQLPVIVTLPEHPEWQAGGAAVNGPVVGFVSELDAAKADQLATYGYTFITAPVSGKGSWGPYNRYHVNRDGSF